MTNSSEITIEKVNSAVQKLQLTLRPKFYLGEFLKDSQAKEPLESSDLAKRDVKKIKANPTNI